jgi:hypothetical protein
MALCLQRTSAGSDPVTVLEAWLLVRRETGCCFWCTEEGHQTVVLAAE